MKFQLFDARFRMLPMSEPALSHDPETSFINMLSRQITCKPFDLMLCCLKTERLSPVFRKTMEAERERGVESKWQQSAQ